IQHFLHNEKGGSPVDNDQKKRVTVDIYGESYTIVGEEQANHVRAVANIVHEKMQEIKNKDPSLDTKHLAVLTAVNVVNDYLKLEEKLDEWEDKNRKEDE